MKIPSLVLVADTSKGPVDVDSIDGEQLIVTVVDGELAIANGVGSLFGGMNTYTVSELTETRAGDFPPDIPIRLELRLIDTESPTR
jgi:hypothetical protein